MNFSYCDGERAIEPPLVAEQRDARGRRLVAEDRPRRIARHEMDQEEDEDRDPERHRHRLQQPADDVARRGSRLAPRLAHAC